MPRKWPKWWRSPGHFALPSDFPIVQPAHVRCVWDGEEPVGMLDGRCCQRGSRAFEPTLQGGPRDRYNFGYTQTLSAVQARCLGMHVRYGARMGWTAKN